RAQSPLCRIDRKRCRTFRVRLRRHPRLPDARRQSSRAARRGKACTLGIAEAAFTIVILFAFSKRKGGSTFGASNFKVWHGYLPSRLFLGFAFDLRKVYSSDMKLYRANHLSFSI